MGLSSKRRCFFWSASCWVIPQHCFFAPGTTRRGFVAVRLDLSMAVTDMGLTTESDHHQADSLGSDHDARWSVIAS